MRKRGTRDFAREVRDGQGREILKPDAFCAVDAWHLGDGHAKGKNRDVAVGYSVPDFGQGLGVNFAICGGQKLIEKRAQLRRRVLANRDGRKMPHA